MLRWDETPPDDTRQVTNEMAAYLEEVTRPDVNRMEDTWRKAVAMGFVIKASQSHSS